MTSGPTRPGAVPHANRKMRDAPAVQVAHHARVGDQVVRQNHQIDGVGRHPGMRQFDPQRPRSR
jgi:hypothetical protein